MPKSSAAPYTPDVDYTPKYDVHRQRSRIPMPTAAQASKPGLFPSPAQPLSSAQKDVSSFALTGEDSGSMSTTDECGVSQRQPSCASASSVDLDSASGREGILFDGGMQSPSAQRCIGDANAVPQSPMVSASPDSMPDSTYTSSEKQTAHCTPTQGIEVDADSVASLGSYLELEDGVQQTSPDGIIPPAAAVTDIQPSHSAVEGAGFTFSALSVTPTHGVPHPNMCCLMLMCF